MGFNLTCPQCSKRMTMDFSTSRVYCPECGYVRADEIGSLETREKAIKATGAMPFVKLIQRGEVMPSAHAAFETGMEYLNKGDKAAAIRALDRALEFQPNFCDAHLWIAKISADPKVQRDHLESILAQMPDQVEALRMLMVLNGRLTAEEAARLQSSDGPQIRQAEGAVAANATELLCPNCGGHLTVDEQAQQVECRSCGYSMPRSAARASGAGDALIAALLKRKAKAVHWNVGKRLVKCQECGAEHTVPADQMAHRCRFCGSMAVILSDVLGSFDQPEGLIPYRITPEQAMEAVTRQLGSLTERIKGWFDTNKVASSVIDGIYVPHWAFDASVEVIQTITSDAGTESNTLQDGMWDVMVCASKSLPLDVVARLGPYELTAVVPYESKWLADVPAQIYAVDFDAAALNAQVFVTRTMKSKYEAEARERSQSYDSRGNKQQIFVSVATHIRTMSFRLLLLPVWIAQLTEQDGDHRIALVNGQTGKVAFGKTQKAQKR